MTQDEIRKLLGGYATNTLSDQERQLLFEAAIEDQELFNALENEDALRELLDDPILRDQLRSGLRGPLAQKRRPAFGSRRWLLGVAIPAVVALILIVVMNRASAPRLIAPVPETVARNNPSQAPPAPESKQIETSPQQAKQQSAAHRRPARVIPAPAQIPPVSETVAKNNPSQAPPAPESKQKETAPQQAKKQSTIRRTPDRVLAAPAEIQAESAPTGLPLARPAFLAAPQSAMPEAVRRQFAAGFSATAPLYQGPLVRYSIVRNGPAGDAVRIDVSTGVAGYLALYRVDASGNSTRVYPERDLAARVLPGLPIQIKLAPAGERLRLVVLPVAQAAVVGQLSSGQLATPGLGGAINGTLVTGAAPVQAPLVPLVVDIPLAPN